MVTGEVRQRRIASLLHCETGFLIADAGGRGARQTSGRPTFGFS